jgi:hypothetical protein
MTLICKIIIFTNIYHEKLRIRYNCFHYEEYTNDNNIEPIEMTLKRLDESADDDNKGALSMIPTHSQIASIKAKKERMRRYGGNGADFISLNDDDEGKDSALVREGSSDEDDGKSNATMLIHTYESPTCL